MERPVSAETLAAQGLGEVDPGVGCAGPGDQPVHELRAAAGRLHTRTAGSTPGRTTRPPSTPSGCWRSWKAAARCALFGSGMAAATAVFQALQPGDHVLVSRVLYCGVRKWLAEFAVTWGLDVEFIDTTDLDAVAAAIRPGRTRLLWTETPANPTWDDHRPGRGLRAGRTRPGRGWRWTTRWPRRC